MKHVLSPTEKAQADLIRRLTVFGAAVCATSLLLAFAGFGVYEFHLFKKENETRLKSQADIISYQVGTPLLFDDKNEAQKALNFLSGDPNLKHAAIYDSDGKLFAFIGKTPDKIAASIVREVFYRGDKIGSIELEADYFGIWDRFKSYLWLSFAIFALVFPFMFFVSRPLRSRITKVFQSQIVTSEALSKSNKELERSNKELEHFAYVASHDLQEPLRMVSSYTQLLARRYSGKLGKDADEFIEFAVDGAKRMQNLIDALLTYARVEMRGKPLEISDSEAMLKNAISNLEIAIEESKAEVTHDPLPVITADAAQMAQVFQNLIGNAIKFRGERTPKVHIQAESVEDDWKFSIKDNGIGIEPKYFEKLFALFQRLHTRQEYPGTGIGLAFCKKVIERHGGRIWLESKPGEGTEFLFLIPKKEKA